MTKPWWTGNARLSLVSTPNTLFSLVRVDKMLSEDFPRLMKMIPAEAEGE